MSPHDVRVGPRRGFWATSLIDTEEPMNTDRIRRLAGLAALSTALLGLAGCGRTAAEPAVSAAAPAAQDAATAPAVEPTPTAMPTPARSVARYCELAMALDKAGSDIVGPVQARQGSDAEIAAAERQLVLDHKDDIDELVAVAPDEIAADTAADIRALRERVGLSTEPPGDADAAEAAESRVLAFQERSCPRADGEPDEK